MHHTESIDEIRRQVASARAAGRRVVFVPTMGALHAGHLRLLDVAATHGEEIVLSIFVNPLQFAPHEDLARYPRPLDRDLELAAAHGATRCFLPATATMYPMGMRTTVRPGPVADRWEGASRPGHFEGVLTVVAKLLHIVAPDVAIFGRKDIQQATLIRQMVLDLDLPVAIVVEPTVREPDGLALSSRNAFLSPAERTDALAISTGLRAARAAWEHGERSASRLRAVIDAILARVPAVVPDYIAIMEPEGLTPVERAPNGTIIAIAAQVGATRLIDNTILGAEDV
ncbi:MAG TPA: pantoate--beta-alanine ligase [Gemmatimonadales bacterium]|nr:pantoate--beta-alanine ligase [Gemmatimonadales bacterium]